MNRAPFIASNFGEAQEILSAFTNNEENLNNIEKAVELQTSALSNNGKLISCGNGGSMCDAIHYAEELSGRFRKDRLPLKAISISDPAYLTCVANDYGYDFVFSRFVQGFGEKGDCLIAISTSGNSKNVVEAAKVAKEKEMNIIALTGKDGGELKSISDISFVISSHITDRIQEMHIKIIHTFIEGIERNLFPENYN